MAARWAVWTTLLVAGCGSTTEGLSVDVKTDFQPGVEFVLVRTALAPASGTGESRSLDAAAAFGDAFLVGRRVAEYAQVAQGDYLLSVELRDARGTTVATRTTRLTFSKAVAVTVLVTRNCRGVVCPAPGGDPAATTCVGGRCINPMCATGTEPGCSSACMRDADCPASAAACAVVRCVDGSCFSEPRDDRCGMGEYCAVDTGCRVRPVTPDAGPAIDGGPCTMPTAETCNGRDDDCNGIVDDGFSLASDPNNCDACGRVCPGGPNATAVCTGGACSTTCAPGHANCNGLATDGCEADTSSSATCGSCSRACGRNSHCSVGDCSCDDGYEDPGTGTCVPAGTCPAGQQRYHTDADHDGHGAGSVCAGCFPIGAPPSGCTTDNTDCNDGDPGAFALLSLCRDEDNDGYTTGTLTSTCGGDTEPSGWRLACNGADCAPLDPALWQTLVGFVDRDGDGYGFSDPVPASVCSGASLPTGYVTRAGDCNDSQATVYPGNPSWYTSTGPSGGSWDYDCSGSIETQYPGYQRCDTVLPSLPLAYCDGTCTPTGVEVGDWCTHSGAANCGERTAVSVTGRCDTACNMHLQPGPTQACH